MNQIKGIFVSSNNFITDTASGGKKCSKRNFELFREIVGCEKCLLYIVSNDFVEDSCEKWGKSDVCYVAGCANKTASIINYTKGYNVMTPRAERKLLSIVEKLDIEFMFFDSSIFGRTIQKVKKIKPNIQTVCFMHNIEKWYGWSRVVHENPLYITYYYASYYNEKKALKWADKVISLTERDRENTYKLYHRRTDLLLPITFQDGAQKCVAYEQEKGMGQEPYFLFIGSLFQPNVEGITWFVENVMSKTTARLKIVGNGLESLRNKLERKNVEVVGGVEELATYYQGASAVVLPIFYGNGMKVKTAEAMMYGKNIIASDEALVGYDVDHIKGIYRCNRPEEFLNAMQIIQKQPLQLYAQEVRDLFLAKYETGSYVEAMKQLFTR